eukprot:ANDGO_04093.mRNA.1 tRNA (carboxymethyluridine(34)-5-O)-methyltransferase
MCKRCMMRSRRTFRTLDSLRGPLLRGSCLRFRLDPALQTWGVEMESTASACRLPRLCDITKLPYRTGAFDAVISIAVIHHLSTYERRLEALAEICRVVAARSVDEQTVASSEQQTTERERESEGGRGRGRGRGRALVYVWALEQPKQRKWGAPGEQDVMVPWHLQPRWTSNPEEKQQQAVPRTQRGEFVFQRYYHLFKYGDLEKMVADVNAKCPFMNITVVECGYDHDNHYIELAVQQVQPVSCL